MKINKFYIGLFLAVACAFSPGAAQMLPGSTTGGGGGSSNEKSYAHLYNGEALGSTNGTIVVYDTLESSGSDFTISHSSTNGTGITINTAGVYSVSITGRFQTGTGTIAIMSSTALNNTFSGTLMRGSQAGANGLLHSASALVVADVDDVIWTYYNRTPEETFAGDYSNQLTITGPL